MTSADKLAGNVRTHAVGRPSKPLASTRHAVDGPLPQFGQHVPQMAAQVDVQTPAGLDNGSDGGNFWGRLADCQCAATFCRPAPATAPRLHRRCCRFQPAHRQDIFPPGSIAAGHSRTWAACRPAGFVGGSPAGAHAVPPSAAHSGVASQRLSFVACPNSAIVHGVSPGRG